MRLAVLRAMVGAATVCLVAAPAWADDPLQTLKLAYGAYQDGLDSLAEEQLRAFLRASPKHPRACEAWFLLGEILVKSPATRAEGLAAYASSYGAPGACSVADAARGRAADELIKDSEPRAALELLRQVAQHAPAAEACEAGLRACDLLGRLVEWAPLLELAEGLRPKCAEGGRRDELDFYRLLARSGLGEPSAVIEEAGALLGRPAAPERRRRILLIRGEALLRAGRAADSIPDLAEAAAEPSEAGDYLLFAASLQAEPAEAALERFERLRERHPEHPRLAEARGGLLDRLSSDEGLRRRLLDFLAACGEPDCRLRLGELRLEAGEAGAALELGRGLAPSALSPELLARALLLEARALGALGRWAEALEPLQALASLRLAPELEHSASALLGQALLRTGKPLEGLMLLERHLLAIADSSEPGSPAWARAILSLAEAYRDAGRLEEARSLLEASLPRLAETAPQMRGFLEALAAIEEAGGRDNLAMADYRRILALPGPLAPAEELRLRLRLAAAFARTGRCAEALGILEAASERLEAYPGSLLDLALCQRAQGSSGPSEQSLRRLLGLAAGLRAEERHEMALRLEDTQPEAALRLLERNFGPEATEPRWAALALSQAASIREGRQEWEQAIRLYRELLDRFAEDPLAPRARRRLRQVLSRIGHEGVFEKELRDRPAMEGLGFPNQSP